MEVVAAVLHGLGGTDRRCVELARQMSEQRAQALERLCVAGADDRERRLVVVADGRALAQEFRLEADVEIDAFALPRCALDDRDQGAFDAARRERRAEHEDVRPGERPERRA